MRNPALHICIVGGGFTGVAGAIACLARIAEPFRLTMVEPAAALGRGVAFGGHHPLHLLNVRTRDLSVRTSQPGDFLNWAFRLLDQGENHSGLHEGLAHTFLPRQLFGEYVRQRFFDAVEQRKDVELNVVRAIATACHPLRGRYQVVLDGAKAVSADVVILATAYGLTLPAGREALPPYAVIDREQLARAKTMVLIGSGLTMVDVLLSARRDGFSGAATIISRRGQLPRPHAAKGVVPQEIGLPKSKRLSLLTAAIRIACEAAEAHGTPWQAIINGLRPSVPDIWRGLPIAEQARFLRHVRPFWDAHRHRLPAEVYARIQAEFAAGQATLVQGHVTEVVRQGEGFAFKLNRRGSAEILQADLAFDCTGHAPDLEQSLLKDLISQGLARPDAHQSGLRLRATARSRMRAAVLGGASSPLVPSARGRCGRSPLCPRSWPRLIRLQRPLPPWPLPHKCLPTAV